MFETQKIKWFRRLIPLTAIILVSGCSVAEISVTQKGLPKVYKDYNDTYVIKRDIQISLFQLYNYTDTPDAGKRAANILQGVLEAKGYKVIPHYKKRIVSFKRAKKMAKKDGSRYFMLGGVSEWRYKNGIDSEPVVSLRLSLYKTKKGKLVWSATGSDGNWGNDSLGYTAQCLMNEMMQKE